MYRIHTLRRLLKNTFKKKKKKGDPPRKTQGNENSEEKARYLTRATQNAILLLQNRYKYHNYSSDMAHLNMYFSR